MFQIQTRSGAKFEARHDTLQEVFRELKFITCEISSDSLLELLDTTTGRYYKILHDGYVMTMAEIKFYEGKSYE